MSIDGEKSGSNLKRLGKYSICEVFEHIDASPRNGQRIKFYGHLMHLRSTRIMNFRVHGIVCVKCGARGAFFAKERHGSDGPHLNLYAFDNKGRAMLMTRDHIRPKAKGGTNHLYNMQPMCVKCNSAKGDTWNFRDRLKYLGRRIKHAFNKNY